MGPSKVSNPAQQALRQAGEHLSAGRVQQAEGLVRQVLQAQPDNHQALNLLGGIALNGGHAPQAAEIFSRAIELCGTDAEYHCGLGVALLSANRADEGEAALRAALKLKPGHPMANFNLGLRDLQAERFEDARQRLDKAVKKMPQHLPALNALGVAYSKCAKPAKAAQLFRAALKLQPNHLDTRLNLAGALTEMGNLDDAIRHYEQMIAAHPDDPRPHFNIGVALRKARRRIEAVHAFERAIQLAPTFVEAHVNLSNQLTDLGQFEGALEHIQIACQNRPGDIRLMVNEARALHNQGLGAETESVCRAILELDAQNDTASSLLIRTMQNDGRFEEARDEANRILAAAPDAVAVLNTLAMDRAYAFGDAQLAVMDKAYKTIEEPAEAARVGFALAKIHHNRGDHAKAFDCFHSANALRDAGFSWTAAQEQELFDAYIQTFSSALFKDKGGLGSPSERPVFIVGMPRSGTTLVEQVIASHPDAEGAGELSEMHTISLYLAETTGESYPAATANLTAARAQEMAERYLKRLERISPSAARVTDKMPDNYQHLGLIALLFPNARVIHCRRDPMATCFSIYQQNFIGNHPYAYDLAKLGRRHRNHERLMDHWRDVLPLPILEVAYEDMVADQEGQSRRILDFCGLAWDAGVLNFHETERTVQTASLWQVRQPIYTGALKGWQAYEEFLGPLKDALAGE